MPMGGTPVRFSRANVPYHIPWHEPLVVNAFHRYAGPQRSVLDIGANMGGYSMLAAALGSTVYAVEMQPGCSALFRCHARANNFTEAQIRWLEGFVPRTPKQAPVQVHPTACNVMASSTATGGRWPHGLLMKSHREMRWNETVPVSPVDLRASLAGVDRFGLTKIDTEGSEIECLLALDWSKLDALIVEFQAGAWKHNNVSRAQGVDVVRRLIAHRSYTIHTLFGTASEVWMRRQLFAFLRRQHNNFREFLFVRSSLVA